MKRLNGSIHEYYAHELAWDRMKKNGENGLRGGLRLGQYVWNMMGRLDKSWPELFYSNSRSVVSRLVHKEFEADYLETPND